MMHLTPVLQFALLLVIPGALVVLLVALLLTGIRVMNTGFIKKTSMCFVIGHEDRKTTVGC